MHFVCQAKKKRPIEGTFLNASTSWKWGWKGLTQLENSLAGDDSTKIISPHQGNWQPRANTWTTISWIGMKIQQQDERLGYKQVSYITTQPWKLGYCSGTIPKLLIPRSSMHVIISKATSHKLWYGNWGRELTGAIANLGDVPYTGLI